MKPLCLDGTVYCFCGIKTSSTTTKILYKIDTSVSGYLVTTIPTTYYTDVTKKDVFASILITASDDNRYQLIDYT